VIIVNIVKKTKIDKKKLRSLILDGISTDELNSFYDYSDIRDMCWLFERCQNLESIPLLDTINVNSMTGMFNGCKNLPTIPLLDTSNVVNMSWMFNGCINLKTIPLLNTLNVTEMYNMFTGCKNLRDLNIEDFRLYDFSKLNNKFLRDKYPEYYL